MRVLTRASVRGHEYRLAKHRGSWWLLDEDGEEFPLDYDARHRRLFLDERDEEYVGASGITALERMTREVISRGHGT